LFAVPARCAAVTLFVIRNAAPPGRVALASRVLADPVLVRNVVADPIVTG
jgi:hypothetical protein